MTLDERLENWGHAWRYRMARGQTASLEGAYRSPQHWDALMPPTNAAIIFNPRDAAEVENAWQAMGDAFHQALLLGHYVRRYAEGKVLVEAWKAAGEPRKRRMSGFLAALGMAHALIAAQLDLPAVVRRDRLAARVRDTLGTRLTQAAEAA